MFLHSKAKFHAKNQENLSRGSPGKLSETERQTDRETETDPNIRVLRTLSLSRRTKKSRFYLLKILVRKNFGERMIAVTQK